MKNLIVLLSVFVVLSFANDELKFKKFMTIYNKNYECQEEYQRRFTVFQDNLRIAEAYQQKEKPNGATFGITKFSDWTREDFAKLLNFDADFMNYIPHDIQGSSEWNSGVIPNPISWNWCAEGACTSIYNQGQCASVAVISLVETVESYYQIAGHQLTALSINQLEYCTEGSEGCNGGFPSEFWPYIIACGIEASYEGESCEYSVPNVVTGVKTFPNITNGEPGLYAQLSAAKHGGPLSVCVDADSWQFYTGGVLTSCGNNVDHCAELVGYGNYNQAGAYWIVRNSWGDDWGESGFIWIEIGHDLCDISDYASYAVLAPPPANPPGWCSK